MTRRKGSDGSLPSKIMSNNTILLQYMNINTGFKQTNKYNERCHSKHVKIHHIKDSYKADHSLYNSLTQTPHHFLDKSRSDTSPKGFKNNCNVIYFEHGDKKDRILKKSIDYVRTLSVSNNNRFNMLNNQLCRLAIHEEKLENKRREFEKIVYGLDDSCERIPIHKYYSKKATAVAYKYPVNYSSKETELAKEYLYKYKNMSQIIAINKRANIELSIENIQCLRPQRWLNDEVINFYFSLLQERNDRTNSNGQKPKAWFWNTFFYTKLTTNQDGDSGYCYRNVSRWTSRKKIDLFNYNLILVPININNVHWTLGVVNFDKNQIMYLDSLGGLYQDHIGYLKMSNNFYENMTRYIHDEYFDKKKKKFTEKLEHLTTFKDPVPQQQNGSDCGVFTCMFAECISDNRSFDFNAESIDDIRVNILVECIRNSIQ